MARTNTVYLLHFDAKLSHAGHYIGSTKDLDSRLEEHRHGQGAKLMAAVMDAGITFRVARLWKGGRKLERKLKDLHCGSRLCPICNPGNHRSERLLAKLAKGE